jgi:hypothetical protein
MKEFEILKAERALGNNNCIVAVQPNTILVLRKRFKKPTPTSRNN